MELHHQAGGGRQNRSGNCSASPKPPTLGGASRDLEAPCAKFFRRLAGGGKISRLTGSGLPLQNRSAGKREAREPLAAQWGLPTFRGRKPERFVPKGSHAQDLRIRAVRGRVPPVSAVFYGP
jgi:hypothetical protein